MAEEKPIDSIAGVAPPPEVREGDDAESNPALKNDPSDADAKLEVGLDETFPSSDAPANTRPGSSDPAPSSGYDEDAERERTKGL